MVKGKVKTGKQPGPKKQKKRVPYNSYVAKKREKHFHETKKTLNKFHRYQRWEQRQQAEKAQEETIGDGRYDRYLEQGADSLGDAFERNLALSFGTGISETTSAPEVSRRGLKKGLKKMKKKGSSVLISEQVNAEPRAAASSPVRNRKKAALGQREAIQTGERDALVATSEHPKKKLKKNGNYEPDDRDQKSITKKLPDRYAKALNEFQQKQQEKDEERKKIEEDMAHRKKQRKHTARERVYHGNLINKRTNRGQPMMHNLLESWSRKWLVDEKKQ